MQTDLQQTSTILRHSEARLAVKFEPSWFSQPQTVQITVEAPGKNGNSFSRKSILAKRGVPFSALND